MIDIVLVILCKEVVMFFLLLIQIDTQFRTLASSLVEANAFLCMELTQKCSFLLQTFLWLFTSLFRVLMRSILNGFCMEFKKDGLINFLFLSEKVNFIAISGKKAN